MNKEEQIKDLNNQLEFNDYCNWYNKSRLNGALGYVSQEEYKNNYRQCV